VIRVVTVLCGLWLLLPAAALGAPSIRAEVSSPRTSVGRPFDYVVRATLDSEDEARKARILAPIGAFSAVRPSSVERDGREVRLTQRLACLGPGCVPRRESRVVALPAARVVADGRTTSAPAVSIAVVPRVPAAAVAADDPVYRRQTGVPPPGFSPRPGVLAGLAAGGAALLVVVAVVLIATGLRGRARAASKSDEYERAVRLLRESQGRQSPDRRRAAGLLGRVARARSGEGLATSADRVAWSRAQPDAAAVGGLAERAERERP
jgi:hypothetical protein